MNLKNISISIFFYFLAFLPFNIANAQATMSIEKVGCEQLTEWITLLEIEDEELFHPEWTRQIYEDQNCEPLWYNAVTRLIFANEMLTVLQNAEDKNDYHLEAIEWLYNDIETQMVPFGFFDFNSLSALDVLLTDAALHYAFKIQEQSPANKKKKADELDEETTALLLIDGLLNSLKSESLAAYFEELKEEGLEDFELTSFEEEPYEEDSLLVSENKETEDYEGKELEEADIEEENAKKEKEGLTDSTPAANVFTVKDSSLYKLVKEISRPASKNIFNEALYHPAWIDSFYKKRNYEPIWHNGYTLYGRGSDVIWNIEKAYEEGLKSKDYHGERLTELHNDINAVYDVKFIPYDNFLPKIDVLITDAALHYAYHLQYGKVNPEKLDIDWHIENDGKVDFAEALQSALKDNDVNSFFEDRKPQHEEYNQLKKALAYYTKLQREKGEWATNINSDKLELGMKDSKVEELRERLSFENPLPKKLNDVEITTLALLKSKADTALIEEGKYAKIVELEDSLILTKMDSLFNPAVFDSVVYRALVVFQQQHGISDDGVIGPNTLSVLNTPLSHRIQQLHVALESWRWMPNNFSDFFVFVNIPAYQLDVYKKGVIDLTKKVMVGKPIFKTVVFNNYIRYLELNPYWNVPFSISTNEILPKLKRNLSYLNRQDMKVFAGGKEINPYSVNWSNISKRNFKYSIRQEPSAKNALGTVKFMFPNKYNIYLHDTPSKSLFVKAERAYSHGCIRLDNPVQFAEYLLQDNPKWDANKIQSVLDGKKNTRVSLDKKVPVYITYFTAWVDSDGVTHFQKDVYDKDKVVIEAL